MYYLKYYCKFNHIEHFWYNTKKWACVNCNYIFDDLQQHILCTLASVSNYTILAYFYKRRQKIDLYWEGIRYRSLLWKVCIVHYKPTNKNNN